jgi:hypothetical protein
MTLKQPFFISSRLLAALQVGPACVQLEYAHRAGSEGRTRYKWTIDLNGKCYSGDDLQSGCQGGNLLDGFISLVSFLNAFAESVNWGNGVSREESNIDLFPKGLQVWACQNGYEFSMLEYELQENPELIVE